MLLIKSALNLNLSNSKLGGANLFVSQLFVGWIVLLFSWGSYGSQGVQTGSAMKGTLLQSCNENRKDCIELHAKTMKGSQFKPLYAFKDGEVVLRKNGMIEKFQADSGFWDAQGDLLVFSTTSEDISVDLKSLKTTHFSRSPEKLRGK